MTTSNGDRGRITAHIEGTVESANERGLRLDSESDWRNFSKWTVEPIAPPRRGANVRLGLDASGFIRMCEVLDQEQAAPTGDRSREIRRQVAAKVAGWMLDAAIQSRDDARIEHFPRVADLVFGWLEQP
jgi:hypothetical protein